MTSADRWAERFSLVAGGTAVGHPLLTRQMRWLPPGVTPGECHATRRSHGVVERCAELGGHPGERHLTRTGVVFDEDHTAAVKEVHR